ncbi:hypothetical protein FACS1894110_23250 [Spirochaetia bacterium]|nr:hypothetical protein FACS1894110_23250 [Spirochaetia bacterium]
MSRKTLIQEGLLATLTKDYEYDPQASSYVDNNLSTSIDIDVFAMQNNISVNYQADSMQVITESFKQAIDRNLQRLNG